eukprot:359586-Chlamydomonas_euryale.AAC.22
MQVPHDEKAGALPQPDLPSKQLSRIHVDSSADHIHARVELLRRMKTSLSKQALQATKTMSRANPAPCETGNALQQTSPKQQIHVDPASSPPVKSSPPDILADPNVQSIFAMVDLCQQIIDGKADIYPKAFFRPAISTRTGRPRPELYGKRLPGKIVDLAEAIEQALVTAEESNPGGVDIDFWLESDTSGIPNLLGGGKGMALDVMQPPDMKCLEDVGLPSYMQEKHLMTAVEQPLCADTAPLQKANAKPVLLDTSAAVMLDEISCDEEVEQVSDTVPILCKDLDEHVEVFDDQQLTQDAPSVLVQNQDQIASAATEKPRPVVIPKLAKRGTKAVLHLGTSERNAVATGKQATSDIAPRPSVKMPAVPQRQRIKAPVECFAAVVTKNADFDFIEDGEDASPGKCASLSDDSIISDDPRCARAYSALSLSPDDRHKQKCGSCFADLPVVPDLCIVAKSLDRQAKSRCNFAYNPETLLLPEPDLQDPELAPECDVDACQRLVDVLLGGDASSLPAWHKTTRQTRLACGDNAQNMYDYADDDDELWEAVDQAAAAAAAAKAATPATHGMGLQKEVCAVLSFSDDDEDMDWEAVDAAVDAAKRRLEEVAVPAQRLPFAASAGQSGLYPGRPPLTSAFELLMADLATHGADAGKCSAAVQDACPAYAEHSASVMQTLEDPASMSDAEVEVLIDEMDERMYEYRSDIPLLPCTRAHMPPDCFAKARQPVRIFVADTYTDEVAVVVSDSPRHVGSASVISGAHAPAASFRSQHISDAECGTVGTHDTGSTYDTGCRGKSDVAVHAVRAADGIFDIECATVVSDEVSVDGEVCAVLVREVIDDYEMEDGELGNGVCTHGEVFAKLNNTATLYAQSLRFRVQGLHRVFLTCSVRKRVMYVPCMPWRILDAWSKSMLWSCISYNVVDRAWMH